MVRIPAVGRWRDAESVLTQFGGWFADTTQAPHGPGCAYARRSAGRLYTPCTHLPNEVGRSEGNLMKKVLVVLALLLVPGIALAVPTITFDTTPGGAGGTLIYGGAGGPLVGTGIVFVDILGTDTPAEQW